MKRFGVVIVISLMGFTSYVHGNLDDLHKLTDEGQHSTRQFLKSITENELPTLIINRPDIGNLIQKAEQGDTDEQFRLANIYQWGSWLPKDRSMADYWLVQSAKGGNRDAARHLYSTVSGTLSGIKDASKYRSIENNISNIQVRLHNTLQLLAGYNEKAFIPNHSDIETDSTNKVDLLDFNRVSANKASFLNKTREKAEQEQPFTMLEERFWHEARKGDIDSLYWLCLSYKQLYEMPERVDFLIKAGELGHIQAQYDIGYLHEQVLKNIEYGLDNDFYTQILSKEMSKEQHLNEMAKWLGKAASAGHLEAQAKVAEAELKLNNLESALKWYTKVAESGKEDGIKGIMVIMQDHESMKTNCLEALIAITKKRKDFDTYTLERIAFTLARTNNAKYCKQAVELYEMVAVKGDSIMAKGDLARIYSQKKDCLCEGAIDKDIEKAIYWYKKGDRRQSLATLYYEEKEYLKAFDIFKTLVEKEREKCTRYAYWALGNCYYEGFGTVKNYYEAYKWFLVYKYYASEYSIDFAETKLSPEMISKAQQEAAKLVEILKREDEESKKKREVMLEHRPDYTIAPSYISRWIESLERISQLLAKALPGETVPTDFSWIKPD